MSDIKKRKPRKKNLKVCESHTSTIDPLKDLMLVNGIFENPVDNLFDDLFCNNAVTEPRNILLETGTFLKDQLDYVTCNIKKLQADEQNLLSLEENLNLKIQNLQTEKNNIYFQKVNLIEQENLLKNLIQQMEFNV